MQPMPKHADVQRPYLSTVQMISHKAIYIADRYCRFPTFV